MSRYSSASSLSANAVESTRSPNNTVNCRRSASDRSERVSIDEDDFAGVARERVASTDFVGEDGAPSAVPHAPQKRLVWGFSNAHDGHTDTNFVPHPPQNFIVAAF